MRRQNTPQPAIFYDVDGTHKADTCENLKEEIAGRKRAEEALQASEDKYQSLFETSAVSFLEVDLSAVKQTADDLKNKDTDDLRSHLSAHPELLQEALKRVTVKKFTLATLRLFQADRYT